MKRITLKAYPLIFAGFFTLTVNAQQKHLVQQTESTHQTDKTNPCATMQYESLLQKRNPARKNTTQFEQWIAPKTILAKEKRKQKNGNVIVTIPVVFHIIHNGSPIGIAENIANEQILSQIDVLNEDFRKLEGSNGYNENPVGGDMEINFCLAKQDPDGILSTGIVRYPMGDGNGWSMNEVEYIKTLTQWDPDKYLNIWVFDDILGVAGYAQFPESSGLEGLYEENELITANTDGIALGHIYVGSEEKYPSGDYDSARNLGQSASHEIGHYFGLRHIWGDGTDCTATDYCLDTPPMMGPNYGCEIGLDTCTDDDIPDMIENYMAYTDDACVNLFTLNQKDRMQAVLENSPRRHSLITSPGCTPGITLENDGSLQINRIETGCGQNTVEPEVVIINTGSSVLTSSTISYHADDQTPAIYNWTGTLAVGESATIQMPAITLPAGKHTFNAKISTINNQPDMAPNNSTRSSALDISGAFSTGSFIVTIQTDDAGSEVLWAITTQEDEDTIIAGNVNSSGQINYYNNNELYTTEAATTENTCYIFYMVDNGLNGLCCDFGNGYYKIETSEGELIAEGGDFMQVEQKSFAITSTLANQQISQPQAITLYPNPANTMLNIATADAANIPESYTVYNSLGQIMDNGVINSASQTLDIAKYANGVYFVKLAKGNSTKTLQFVKY